VSVLYFQLVQNKGMLEWKFFKMRNMLLLRPIYCSYLSIGLAVSPDLLTLLRLVSSLTNFRSKFDVRFASHLVKGELTGGEC